MGKSIFGPWDYAVLAAMLFISAGIGIYYRFTGGRQRTTQEYLLGDRSLSVLPVAVSLMASFMSAITLLGVSSENYTFGTQFVVINFAYALATPICAYCYLPVFFRLQATSAYHYLELRFGKTARLAASFAFSLQMVLYMGIVLYAPALTLEAVTGLSKTAAILSIGIVCTFYSTIGGMKAVVVTDVFQSLLMFAAIYVVVIKATVDAGGLVEIWQIAVNGGRIEFDNFDPDPTVRHTWWSLVIGGGFTYMSLYAVNQAQVQRLLSIKNLRRSQRALWISWPVLTLLSISTCFSGIGIYSKYYNCDPLKDGRISQYDQLMPLYVVESMGHLPGLSGLFVAGIFSGSLSTVSSAMNSLSAVTLEDYIKPLYQRCNGFPLPDSRSGYISKFLALLYGVLCLCIAFAAQHLGGILQASLTIFGVVGGPLFGLFTLGMFIPVANETGAVTGLLVGLMIALWIGFGGPKPPLKLLPMRTDGCVDINLQNVTVPVRKDSPEEDTFILYKLSYMWYVVIGFIVTMVVGILISIIVNKIWRSSKTDPDHDLFAPVVQRLLTRKQRTRSLFANSADVRNANGIEVIKVSPEFDRRSITSEKHKFSESSGL